MSGTPALAARRKAGNPNKDPDLLAEKKAVKAERDALRKRAEQVKAASWKYGLGAAAVIIGGMTIYSLVTISRATIVTVQLDDAVQLKEVSRLTKFSSCALEWHSVVLSPTITMIFLRHSPLLC